MSIASFSRKYTAQEQAIFDAGYSFGVQDERKKTKEMDMEGVAKTTKEAEEACKKARDPFDKLMEESKIGAVPHKCGEYSVGKYVSIDWQPKDWNELFSKIDELFVAPIKEHKERSMHLKQQKILEIAKDQSLEKLTLRQIGELIGVSHPQQVDHHLKMLIRHRFIDKKRRVL